MLPVSPQDSADQAAMRIMLVLCGETERQASAADPVRPRWANVLKASTSVADVAAVRGSQERGTPRREPAVVAVIAGQELRGYRQRRRRRYP